MKLVLGSMELGRRLNPESFLKICQDFKALGHNEVDTASLYANGDSETLLGGLHDEMSNLGIKISTKVNPNWKEYAFREPYLQEQFQQSLKKLKLEKVDILYLHWPSKQDSLNETIRAIGKLYKAGLFERLGLSNFSAWQVMHIIDLCRQEDCVKPTVYQGMYNMFTRSVEDELIPCLRSLGISFYAYSPLAGGILTGRYFLDDLKKFDESTTPNRFFLIGGPTWTKAYQDRFWNERYFQALEGLKSILKIENKGPGDFDSGNDKLIAASFSWLKNHSVLKEEFGDAIILGNSSYEQYSQNISSLKNEIAFTERDLEEIELLYAKHIGSACPKYFR